MAVNLRKLKEREKMLELRFGETLVKWYWQHHNGRQGNGRFGLSSVKLGQFDVDAVTEGGGKSGKTSAVRLAVSRAFCAFVTPEEREKLRLGGLLTRDSRFRERFKQAPHKGARAKWRWKKR